MWGPKCNVSLSDDVASLPRSLFTERDMLDFLFHKKRDEVKRVLHGRVNRAHARTISLNNLRGATRGTVSEVVWIVPCSSVANADYTRVFPAVMRDMSTEGLGIIHNAPITEPCAIVGLRD